MNEMRRLMEIAATAASTPEERVARWRAWAIDRITHDHGVIAQDGYWMREYERVLPKLTAAYEAMPPDRAEEIMRIDQDFHDGKRDGLIAWARTIDSSAFPQHESGAPVIQPYQPLHVQPVESLEGLPHVLYHYSRAPEAVLTQGIYVPYGEDIGDNDAYTWKHYRRYGRYEEQPISWGKYAWSWYRGLTPEGRRSLQQQVGGPIRSIDDLGKSVSMFWTFDTLSHMQSGMMGRSPILVIDPRKLAIFGWFGCDELGKGETVLILASPPQSGPDAIVDVIGDPPA